MTETVRQRLALVVSVAGAMIVALDGTVLTVAQPELQRDFGSSVEQVQWTSTGYMLAVAALLVIAGRLGDRYGHKRLLLFGVLGFGATSGGIMLAPDIGWVIGMRALQGVFGALLQPATLALLRLAYPADKLNTPVAIRTSSIGVAAATGPVLGGFLVAHFGWRAVFTVNVPIAMVIAVFILFVRVPAPSGRDRQRLDLLGSALLAAMLTVFVHTIGAIPRGGWSSSSTLLGFVATAGFAVALVMHERRTANPIVPPAVLRSVPVTASMVILLLTTSGMFGALFVSTFSLQDVLGLDPFAAGLRVLPMTVLMVVGAPAAAGALSRYGARRCAITGTLLVAFGIVGLVQIESAGTWWITGLSFAVLGAGFATVMVTATGTVVGDAPAGYAGVVGGLKQTAMNIGPTLGITVAATMMVVKPSYGGVPATASSPAASFGLGHTLLVLAAIAALAALPGWRLPSRASRTMEVAN
ncbi:MFS transporter [Streptomyces sp. NRRL B-1140]|uniref:MFS transporter n=1 Tax=Streptomyces sp. NRRL B-1140 TaxID=1415549 RepID=UPI0006C404A7|nr:MFS transporter [Streptomyces sp. NRRL B-1140]KOX06487.1 MFS transporter [Streptomyces sp. NRRL B-1140]